MAAHGGSQGQGAYCAQLCGDCLAAGSTNGTVAIYDVRLCAKVAEAGCAHAGGTFSMHLRGDRLVTGGNDGVVLAWDVGRLAQAGTEQVMQGVQRQRQAQAQEVRQHSGCVYSVRQGDDWRVASAGAEGHLVVWRHAAGK
jgi:WD40 repeat protein